MSPLTESPSSIPRFRDAPGRGFVVTVGADIPSGDGFTLPRREAATPRGKAAAIGLPEPYVGGGGIGAEVHFLPAGASSFLRALLGDGKVVPVEEAVMEAAAGEPISCRAAFRVAGEEGVPVAEAGRIIQRRKVKMFSCQLGCFR